MTKVLKLACSGIRRHYYYGIAEVNHASVAVRHTSLVQYLQQQVEHVAMCLLNLVEQHDRVGMTSHTLGKLSALAIAHISRRRSNKTRRVELLRILAHVDTHQSVLCAKHLQGQLLCQIGLAHTRRTQEHEHANWSVGVFQAQSVALYASHNLVHSLVLSYYGSLQGAAQTAQTVALLLRDALQGHARHGRHNALHIRRVNGLAIAVVARSPFVVKSS